MNFNRFVQVRYRKPQAAALRGHSRFASSFAAFRLWSAYAKGRLVSLPTTEVCLAVVFPTPARSIRCRCRHLLDAAYWAICETPGTQSTGASFVTKQGSGC